MPAQSRRTGGKHAQYAVYLRDTSGTERRIALIQARNEGHARELARKAGYGAAVRVEAFASES
jgi:hypothetical protein